MLHIFNNSESRFSSIILSYQGPVLLFPSVPSAKVRAQPLTLRRFYSSAMLGSSELRTLMINCSDKKVPGCRATVGSVSFVALRSSSHPVVPQRRCSFNEVARDVRGKSVVQARRSPLTAAPTSPHALTNASLVDSKIASYLILKHV